MILVNNQSAKADAGKYRPTLVPPSAVIAIAKVRSYGIKKYAEGGPDNWRRVEPERYRDAMYRHLLEYIKNPKAVDPESGLPHLYHIGCNFAFLVELEDLG